MAGFFLSFIFFGFGGFVVVVVVVWWVLGVITRVTVWYNFLSTGIHKISLLSNMSYLTLSQESKL